MANIEVRDGDVAEKFLKAAGAGTDVDPFIPQGSTTLLAGTAAFGKLAANSGVDIGDVDVTSIAAGENHIGIVTGVSAQVTGNFTRPADTTAYASGDLVANNTTAGSVTPVTLAVARANDVASVLRRLIIKKSTTGLTNALFRAHFYNAAITAANGDNGAWSTTYSGYLGCVDVTIDKAFTDAAVGMGTPCIGSELLLIPATGTQNVYVLLEARAAYTPGNAEVFTLYAEVFRD